MTFLTREPVGPMEVRMGTAPHLQHRTPPWRPSERSVRRACAMAFAGWTLTLAGSLVIRGCSQTAECTFGQAESCSDDLGSGVVMAVAGYLLALVAAAGAYRIARTSPSVARGAAAYALSAAVGLFAIAAGNLVGVHTGVGVFATVATFAIVLLPPISPKSLVGAILATCTAFAYGSATVPAVAVAVGVLALGSLLDEPAEADRQGSIV